MSYKFSHIHLILFFILLSLQPSFGQNNRNDKVLVATNDCGNIEKDLFMVKGNSYTLPSHIKASVQGRTCTFGNEIIYAFDQVDINADYWLEVSFLADAKRELSISADGNFIVKSITIPKEEEITQWIHLPKKAYAYGQLVLIFEQIKGANAIVNKLNIYSSNPQPLMPLKGKRKHELQNGVSYTVETDIDVEHVLPTYVPFPSFTNGVSTPIISLNGEWQFSEQINGNKWASIQVPGQWNMQGFKVDSAEWGHYRKDFKLPTDWKGQQIKIRFDGVHSEYKVILNGQKIGYHLGGMTPYELNITPYLHTAKENRIELLVRSESIADMLGSLTQYAAHQLGGITRKVTLLALPTQHIEDLRVITDLDKQYKDARLKLYITVNNNSNNDHISPQIQVSLDKHIATCKQQLPSIPANSKWSGWIELDVNAPLLWNNEQPHLYKLSVDLQRDNETLQKIEKVIGFREIEVQGNQVLVNGTPIKLRGVCRHEVHPLTGRVLTPEQQFQDAIIFREANCNFIRTSHYPPAEEFIEACDTLGLFVEVEAPICWIGHHANSNWKTLNYRDSIYYPYVLQANMEMIHFYRNHPSVTFWSMANESYWNKEFAQVLEYIKQADTTRPSAFHDQAYGGFNNQGSTAPIANIHYPGPNGYKTAQRFDRPIVYGEYCHLNVYNRKEIVTDPGVRSDWALAIAPTWENMYTTKAILGGSIWSGIDDIFQLPDGQAKGYGPWGPIDGWRRRKPEHWDLKKAYSPIKIYTKELKQSSQLRIDLENRYTYLNLKDLRIEWQYGKERGMISTPLRPKQKGNFTIQIQDPQAANQLYLKFIDPKGFTTDEFMIPVGQQQQNEIKSLPLQKTRLKTLKKYFHITGRKFDCKIDRTTGQFISLVIDKDTLVNGGPHLMVLSLTGGGCLPNHNANTPIHNDVCCNWTATSVNAHKIDQEIHIEVKGSYKEFQGRYTLIINSGGELHVEYHFNALTDINPRQWGLVFDAPKHFNQLIWRRDGLWSIYPSNHIGRNVGRADLFYDEVPTALTSRMAPTWDWSNDHNELGSNDFRSTKRNIWYATLESESGHRITARSDGHQHWRSWFHTNKIQFLIADFVTAGNEMFLEQYYAPYRKPIKKGEKIEGIVSLQLK